MDNIFTMWNTKYYDKFVGVGLKDEILAMAQYVPSYRAGTTIEEVEPGVFYINVPGNKYFAADFVEKTNLNVMINSEWCAVRGIKELLSKILKVEKMEVSGKNVFVVRAVDKE